MLLMLMSPPLTMRLLSWVLMTMKTGAIRTQFTGLVALDLDPGLDHGAAVEVAAAAEAEVEKEIEVVAVMEPGPGGNDLGAVVARPVHSRSGRAAVEAPQQQQGLGLMTGITAAVVTAGGPERVAMGELADGEVIAVGEGEIGVALIVQAMVDAAQDIKDMVEDGGVVVEENLTIAMFVGVKQVVAEARADLDR